MPIHGYDEDHLAEQPAVDQFADLGWTTTNCHDETFEPDGTLGWTRRAEVGRVDDRAGMVV